MGRPSLLLGRTRKRDGSVTAVHRGRSRRDGHAWVSGQLIGIALKISLEVPLPAAVIRTWEGPVDLNTLLSTLIQEARTGASLQSGLSANLPATPRLDPRIPSAAASGPALTSGQAAAGGAALASSLAVASGPALASGQAVAGGAALASSLAVASGPALASGLAIPSRPALASGPGAAGGPAVVSRSSAPSTSPSLLTQNGVNSYVQLLHALHGRAKREVRTPADKHPAGGFSGTEVGLLPGTLEAPACAAGKRLALLRIPAAAWFSRRVRTSCPHRISST